MLVEARGAGGGCGLLARHLGALAGGQQLVDEDGERDARPDEQRRPRDQRDALLPDGAHAQEPDVAVRADEDFMVLKQRIEALAPSAQPRRKRRQVTTPSWCSDSSLPAPLGQRPYTRGTPSANLCSTSRDESKRHERKNVVT